jgi:hypothetical protein
MSDPTGVAHGIRAELASSIHIRAVGASTGFKVKRPLSWGALLDVATRHVLNNTARVTHVFDQSGDRILELDVVSPGDVLYVGTSDAWHWPSSPVRPSRQVFKAGRASILERDGSAAGDSSFSRKRAIAAGSAPLGAVSVFSTVILSSQLGATPHRLTQELPQRLCASKPPWGLLGDHTQLGSDANFTQLRGGARQQALLRLCERFAAKMQQRSLTALGAPPPLFPGSGPTCAVVGSSGALGRSYSGRAIDSHDVVVRFNLAPAGGVLAAHVGERTTLRMLTDKTYQVFLRSGAATVSLGVNQTATARGGAAGRTGGRGQRSRGQGGRTSEPKSILLLYCMAQGWVGRCMHENRMDHVNPVFVKHLRSHLEEYHGRGRLPSAGMVGIAMAVSRCSHVSLFGFGNASDTNGTAECGHYWECSRQQGQYYAGKAGYHDWNAQWRLLSSWIAKVTGNKTVRDRLVFHDPRARYPVA